jgi:hypothetical protein
MSTDSSQPHASAAARIEHVAAPIDAETAAEALKHGPRGALVVATCGFALRRLALVLFRPVSAARICWLTMSPTR